MELQGSQGLLRAPSVGSGVLEGVLSLWWVLKAGQFGILELLEDKENLNIRTWDLLFIQPTLTETCSLGHHA